LSAMVPVRTDENDMQPRRHILRPEARCKALIAAVIGPLSRDKKT
jgi:hypothetical protein